MVDDPTSFPPVEPHTYTKKNSLLSDDEIDMVVTLRMNRDFMAEYHVRVRKKSCKQANRLILWGRGTDIFFLNFFVFCFSITFFLSFFFFGKATPSQRMICLESSRTWVRDT